MSSSERQPRSPRGVNKENRVYTNVADNLGLDLDELHSFLWKKSNRFGMLLISQSEVAKSLNLNVMSASRLFRLLEQQGRLRLGLNEHKWQIADPEVWKTLSSS